MTDSPVTTAKNFLTSSEKQLGAWMYILGLIAFIVGGVIFKDVILSTIAFAITVVGGTIAVGIGAVLIFSMWMLFTSPAFWTELRMLNYQFMRGISNMLMKANPFGRMRAFANEYLQEKWEQFNKSAVKIEAQKHEVSRKLERDREALENSTRESAAIQKRHQQPDGSWDDEQLHGKFRIEATRMLFLEDAIKKGEKRLQRLIMLVTVLDKWRNTFKFEIEMTRMTADYLEQDFNSANEETNALEAASNAFGHGNVAQADKEVRNYIEKLTSDRMARADVLMKQIPELTAVGDLKGDIAEEEIMRRLKGLDNDAQKALVEVQEDHRHMSVSDPLTIIRAKEKVPARRFLK